MQPETGFTICRRGKDLISGCESTGDSHKHISMRICCPHGGKPVGSFHTHPGGEAIPSNQDIIESTRLGLELLCIGVPETKEARCYRLKRE